MVGRRIRGPLRERTVRSNLPPNRGNRVDSRPARPRMGHAVAASRTPTASPLQGWKATILRRVLRGRCPQCGAGALFTRRARLGGSCGDCGLVYRREPGAMTGSMYLSAAVTQVFAAGLLFAGFLLTDWTLPVFLLVALPLAVAFCVWFLPRSMALWVAVEYMTDLANGESWARPRA